MNDYRNLSSLPLDPSYDRRVSRLSDDLTEIAERAAVYARDSAEQNAVLQSGLKDIFAKYKAIASLTVELELAYRHYKDMRTSHKPRSKHNLLEYVCASLAAQYPHVSPPNLLPRAVESAVRARPELEDILSDLYDGLLNIVFNFAYPSTGFRPLHI